MKKILLLAALLCTSLSLSAGPIGQERARQIAEDFFAKHTTRAIASNIELEWAGDNISDKCATGSELDNSLLYIYNFGSNNGFVVVAGDSNATPIIAYSFDTTLDVNNMADATADILEAWCRQVEDARKSAKPISSTTSTTRADEEVLFETALWDQIEPYNREAPLIDGQRAMTGCAATAMAIVCHYHRWPERGVGTTPAYFYEMFGNRYDIEANTLGREYDFDNMLMTYSEEYTKEQGDAVAALMKDIGTSILMNYHYSGSAAVPSNMLYALATYFGYSKQMEYAYGDSYRTEEWAELVRENVRKYGPTIFSGAGVLGGHGFVVDGFKADYFHFNFGWSGLGNGYFLLPAIDYYQYQSMIMYLEPDKDGTTEYCESMFLFSEPGGHNGICSYHAGNYTTGTEFECLLGGFWNLGIMPFTGNIDLVLCDKGGNIKEHLFSYRVENFEYMSEMLPEERIKATITQNIEHGDRLRIYYKGDNSDTWKWMQSYNASYTEVLLTATAEELAEGLHFRYEKNTRALRFSNDQAMTLAIYDNDTNELISAGNYMMTETAEFSDIEPGTYRIEISLGDKAYVLTVML